MAIMPRRFWSSLSPARRADSSALRGHPWKRPADAILSLVLLIATLPLMLATGILVRLTSRGSALYCQRRLGRNGRIFTMYKIRTMVQGCEARTGPCWAAANDPRVIPLGRYVRQTHIDELPQLWNVLRGEMSLVGPRPERPEFLSRLERGVPDYGNRLRVLPGITGLAQIQLPPDTDMASVRRKVALDLHYARHCNPWLDLGILLCTALYLAGLPVALGRSIFDVPGENDVPGDSSVKLQGQVSPVSASRGSVVSEELTDCFCAKRALGPGVIEESPVVSEF